MSTQTIKDPACPSATTLRRFLNDEVSAADVVTLAQHIDTCAVCAQALERLVGGLPGPLDGVTPWRGDDHPTEASVPSTQTVSTSPIEVPGYQLLGELGRGGMGVVYKARQVRPDRVVALKMLLAGRHAGPKERARFLQEAEAVAQLQHPHIVPLYEAGQHGELPYLTLEFASGGSLADLLKGTPLPPGDAARVVEQVARGMHYAHERGILHRDLKPANILLAVEREKPKVQSKDTDPHGPSGNPRTLSTLDFSLLTPKITDFGLAKNIAAGTDLTSSNAVFGTPSYMAPEQAVGTAKQVGAATDVYALGAILYECLTGRPPFHGPTPADTLLQVLSDEPVPPSRLQHTVPRDLETICLKCLQKGPQQRYASALELAHDLRRAQAGEPIRARPVGRGERLVKWCRRHPAVAALSTVLVLLTLIAGSLVTWQWRQAVSALAEARSEKTARARRQVAALPDAAAARVPAILEELDANRDEVLPLLRQLYQEEKEQLRRMRLALALLPVEPDLVRAPLTEWMLRADDPAEVLLAREALRPHRAELAAPLWAKADDVRTPAGVRFRTLVALAAYDPHDVRWHRLGPHAVEQLLWANPLHRALWTEALRPVGQTLLPALTEASYYPLKMGTRWHFRLESSNGESGQLLQEIAKIETIDGQVLARLEAVVKGEVVGSEHLSSNAKGVLRHRYNGSELSPPIRLLKFPIQVGESWQSEHKCGDEKFTVTCRVGSEEIEVPAGKYKTVRVELEADSAKMKMRSTYWFAAGIGLVKQTIVERTTMTTVLERFEEGR